MVLLAGQQATPEAQDALEKLCATYWRPLFLFARRSVPTAHDAEDLTQAFFEHLLERGALRSADPERGRFRTFLLSSFHHFITSDWRKAHASRRGGRHRFVPWGDLTPSDEARLAGPESESPEAAYDREWARRVFGRATELLHEEFVAAGKARHFELMKQFLAQPPHPGSYDQLGAELGMTASNVAVAVHRLRQRYRDLVRHEIAQTVSRFEDVEDELRHLRQRLVE